MSLDNNRYIKPTHIFKTAEQQKKQQSARDGDGIDVIIIILADVISKRYVRILLRIQN